jgi:hypothetical protein
MLAVPDVTAVLETDIASPASLVGSGGGALGASSLDSIGRSAELAASTMLATPGVTAVPVDARTQDELVAEASKGGKRLPAKAVELATDISSPASLVGSFGGALGTRTMVEDSIEGSAEPETGTLKLESGKEGRPASTMLAASGVTAVPSGAASQEELVAETSKGGKRPTAEPVELVTDMSASTGDEDAAEHEQLEDKSGGTLTAARVVPPSAASAGGTEWCRAPIPPDHWLLEQGTDFRTGLSPWGPALLVLHPGRMQDASGSSWTSSFMGRI